MRRLLGEGEPDLPGEEEARARLGPEALFELREVNRFVVRFDAELPVCELLFQPVAPKGQLMLRMTGVRHLLLPEILAAPLVLSELLIQRVSGRQLEGVRFSVNDREGSGLKCMCAEVELLVLNGTDS